MGYRKITNLYKDQTVLMFKKVYALEKIHGTSAHLTFHYYPEHEIYGLRYFSGGENHEKFIGLFKEKKESFLQIAKDFGYNTTFTVFGEAYGGKQQKMSETYGKKLKFVVFEVKIGEKFVGVEYANKICEKLGLEFVHYEIIDTDPDLIDKLANSSSVQAKRNGVENPKLPREGVVLRPLCEFLYPDGVERIIAKHKNDIYKEREHVPKLKNPEQLKVLEDARMIAEEWVVVMRLDHVLDKLKIEGIELDPKNMNKIIKAMAEDVYIEAKEEIVEGKEVYKAIGKKTAKLVIQKLKGQINENKNNMCSVS